MGKQMNGDKFPFDLKHKLNLLYQYLSKDHNVFGWAVFLNIQINRKKKISETMQNLSLTTH